jgi:hypothetical protein
MENQNDITTLGEDAEEAITEREEEFMPGRVASEDADIFGDESEKAAERAPGSRRCLSGSTARLGEAISAPSSPMPSSVF